MGLRRAGFSIQNQKVCDATDDIDVTVEVHQNSPVDNSWSAVRLHEMIDRENFGINPDMGNVVWNYDVPEEDYDAAIDAMAPISKYWHCKNLHRVYHPENQRTVFIRVPLQDGEVDYRYAISAMAKRGLQRLHGNRGHAERRPVAQGTAFRWTTRNRFGPSSKTDSLSKSNCRNGLV